uniref:Putative ubiquitin-activating enzyme n=1 Tax=Zea mays TaxID=4577 RepID=Q6PNA1_MAIZE|nr:putative ubiquitin-activating enzyme [Zea mays]
MAGGPRRRLGVYRTTGAKRSELREPQGQGSVHSKTKYDRQLRIWGDQGQTALEKASICLLNCGPTGTEALKNLVLGGIGSVTVVDGSKVEASDLGNNFMLDEGCLGQPRAKSICSFLQELNDAVKAKFVEEFPTHLIDTDPSFFSQFTVVIATQIYGVLTVICIGLSHCSVKCIHNSYAYLPSWHWSWQNLALRARWMRPWSIFAWIGLCVCSIWMTLILFLNLLPESSLLKLDDICRKADIVLVAARSYGLTGLVRVSVKEHCVIESKPDHFLDDLRLHNPWTELKQFAKSIDINDKDPVVHKHTPYIVVLVRLAEKWADAHDGNMPSTRQEKKEFKDLIRAHMLNVDEENYKEAVDSSYKVSVTPGISNEIHQIIDDDSAEVNSSSEDFWILVAALKEFISKEGNGELPLEGTIPDMTSLTERRRGAPKVMINLPNQHACSLQRWFCFLFTEWRGLDIDNGFKRFRVLICVNYCNVMYAFLRTKIHGQTW